MSEKPRKVSISRYFPGLSNYSSIINRTTISRRVQQVLSAAGDVKVMSFFRNLSFFSRRHVLFSHIPLFELDRGRRLTGAVVEHAVDVLDLIDDAAGDSTQHVPGHIVALGGHEVSGGDGAQGHGVVVGALVAHDADAVHIGQSRIILADFLIEAGLGDLLTPDGVGVLHDSDLLGGHFADDADAQTGAGEGLAADQILGQTPLTASLTDFVLEQVAQRLDQLLEVHGVRQAADVVVALDDGGLTAQTALDDIGVNGTLCKEIDLADLLREIQWCGKDVSLSLEVNAESKPSWTRARSAAKKLLADCDTWDKAMRELAAKNLTELANNWLSQDEENPRNPETDPITEDELARRISLTSLSVTSGGSFTAWFDCDEMFTDHAVTVYGSLKKGLKTANIEG